MFARCSQGGFLLPSLASRVLGTTQNESEIAHPGSCPRLDVRGLRTVSHVNWSDARTSLQGGVMGARKGVYAAVPDGIESVSAALAMLNRP